MGKIYQCIGRVAGTPYTVKNTHINLYCIEELCYYIVHNAELMDQTLASEELISWVNEECGLKDLAVKIKERLHHSIRPEAVAETVLNYCHYCSADELERTLKVIKGVRKVVLKGRSHLRNIFLPEKGMHMHSPALRDYISMPV